MTINRCKAYFVQIVLLEQILMRPSKQEFLHQIYSTDCRRHTSTGATAVRDTAPSQKRSPVSAHHRVLRGVAVSGTPRVDAKATSADCETS